MVLFIIRWIIYATPPVFATFVGENEDETRTKSRKRGGGKGKSLIYGLLGIFDVKA